MSDEVKHTCADCRHVATDKRPRIIDATGFDDQMMFDDEDEVVYSCRAFAVTAAFTGIGPVRDEGVDGDVLHLAATVKTQVTGARALCSHAGKTIGTVPILCEAWEGWSVQSTAGAERLAELDRLIAVREARVRDREKS